MKKQPLQRKIQLGFGLAGLLWVVLGLLLWQSFRLPALTHSVAVLGLIVWSGFGLLWIWIYRFIQKSFQELSIVQSLLDQEIRERAEVEAHLVQAREKALAASNAKSEFLAVISHEIRTPMNGVIGMTGLLLETALNAEQLEYVQTLRKSGTALLNLINDLLDFTKLESGKLELESQPFELLECLEDAIDVVAPKAIEKDLELFYRVNGDIPHRLNGDVTRLRQVLVNLLSNAIKFTEQGHIELQVRLLEQSPEQLHLQMEVVDTGIGIPLEKKARIFESFSQADSSTTRKYGGTGLGLSIARNIVEQMGGKLWVHSEVGVGTTFFFTVQMGVVAVTEPETQELFAGKRIALLESNPIQRAFLSALLQQWNVSLVSCDSPGELLTMLENRQPVDLLILSWESLDELLLKRLKPLKQRLIVLSGHKHSELCRTHFLENVILVRPFRHYQLKRMIQDKLADTPVIQSTETEAVSVLDKNLAQRYPLRILVAEDHPVNQLLARGLLEKMGYFPDMAGNGVEVLSAMADKTYDLIFMDIQMPEMDGLEATREIKRQGRFEHTPIIIAMTAHVGQADRRQALDCGMSDFIRKPILKEELQHSLIRWGQHLSNGKGEPESLPMAEVYASNSGMNASSSGIDRAALLERVEQDEVMLKELLQLYIVECPKLLEKIRNEVSIRQYGEIRILAHTLKGMCQNVSANQMQLLALKLEQLVALSSGWDESEITMTLMALESEFEFIWHTYESSKP